MDRDFNSGFVPPYMDYNMPPLSGLDMGEMINYYQCLCLQMDYKIKCKEYENMCNRSNVNERTNRKVE